MDVATCVSQAVAVIKRDGKVHLDAYLLTACLVEIELRELEIPYEKVSIDKWNHIFTVC